jgi:hypothetical protein
MHPMPVLFIAAALLQPFAHSYVVSATIKGKTFVASRWEDKLEATTVDGRPAFRRTQISIQTNGIVRTWISIFDAGSLAPISDTFNSSDGEIFARVFDSGHVTDYASMGADKGRITVERAELPVTYSDFTSGQFGLALLRLPLAPNYRTTLTTFGPTDSRVQFVPIAVLRAQTLHYGACSLETLVVRASFSGRDYPDEGDNSMTFWLAKKPPYVARLLTETPRSGLIVSYDLSKESQSCG